MLGKGASFHFGAAQLGAQVVVLAAQRGQRLLLGEAVVHDVGPGDVDIGQRIAGRADPGDVDGLDLADVGQDRVELPGEGVEFAVGQGQAGQFGQPSHFFPGDRGHGG